jgi:hypothetical protein
MGCQLVILPLQILPLQTPACSAHNRLQMLLPEPCNTAKPVAQLLA